MNLKTIFVSALVFVQSTIFAHAVTDEELKQVSATIINMNGFLCAEVVDIRGLALDGQFEVTCIEYRGGSGTVRYIMNAREGTVFKA